MPRLSVYSANVDYLQLLDEKGRLDSELAKGTLDDDAVKALYERMFIAREFDEAAFKLQRSGRMGTYAQHKGQEAVSLGAVSALKKGVDHVVGYYRDSPGLFLHGLPMHMALLPWMGDERGNAIARKLEINPICVAIGTQALHAVGIAWAFKLRKEKRVVLCFFGEGATSTGDFHEAMNLAAVQSVPCVFCCVNNGWAISVPVGKQTASRTFAQKALAYDIPTIQVDGNDIFAVYKAHREAVERAREGHGPQFIEALTYRLGDHTTADDARRYRPSSEYEAAQQRDPLLRTRKYLESVNRWSEEDQSRLNERSKVIVHEAIDAACNMPKQPATDVFDFTFAELPADLELQKQMMRTDSIGLHPDQIGLANTQSEILQSTGGKA